MQKKYRLFTAGGDRLAGSQAHITVAVLRQEIKDTLCICVKVLCTGFMGSLYMFVSVHLVGVHCVG
jgi:hypothetical protein